MRIKRPRVMENVLLDLSTLLFKKDKTSDLY